MGTPGFKYLNGTVPVPPISSTGPGPCMSIGTGPHGHRYHCGRRAAHPGRHVSYGVAAVIATWPAGGDVR